MTEARIRTEAAWLYRKLAEHRLIVGSSGNVSGRIPKRMTPAGEMQPDGMLITPSGGTPEDVSDADLARVSLDGERFDQATASSEWALHAAVYRTCPEAGFVAHTHADACTALACLNAALPAFHYLVVQFGGEDVRCAPYVTFGTNALAELAAIAIRDRSACLLANHGMIVCAATASQTLNQAVLLETLCRQYLLARSAGSPRLLSAEEMRQAQERFRTYGKRAP